MRELKNHPGEVMQDAAAIQFDKFEDDHGVIGLNRVTVSVAEQQEAIDRWNRGGAANRPPFLYEPKQPAWASEHVQGIAFDTSWITHTLRYGDPYGFYQRYSWDKPHFEFDAKRVKIRPNSDSVETPIKRKMIEMLPMLVLQDTADVWAIIEGHDEEGKAVAQKRRVTRAEMSAYRAAAKAQGFDLDRLLQDGMSGVKLSDIPTAPKVK